MDEEVLVTDVTTEMLGERRDEWRDGFDSGQKSGTQRVLQSDALEQLVLELVMQRATVGVAIQRERLLEHWKAEARWWHEEHDRLSAEHTAFVSEMVRRFAKP